MKFGIKNLSDIWDSVHATPMRDELKKEVTKRVNQWVETEFQKAPLVYLKKKCCCKFDASDKPNIDHTHTGRILDVKGIDNEKPESD